MQDRSRPARWRSLPTALPQPVEQRHRRQSPEHGVEPYGRPRAPLAVARGREADSVKATIRLRKAGVAAGLAALLVGAAACGTAGPQGSSSGGGSGSASAWILSGATEKTFTDSFDAWNTAHPDQKFAVQTFANDPYKQK